MFRTLRLPLFNADGAMGGGDGSDSSASSNSAGEFSPAWGLPQGGNQAAAATNPLFNPEQSATPVGQPEVFDFAGRKIEVKDPAMLSALKDVHKDYSALQGTYTQTSQRMKELEQANQTYLSLLQNVQGQQQQPAAQAQSNQPSEDDIEQMKADFMESFYDDPKTAIESILDSMFQSKVQPIIEPISKEREWNEQVQTLSHKYPDFQTMVGPMQELLQEMPELAQHGLEKVYQIAQRSNAAQQAVSPEQLMNDPQFLQQVMSRPDVQKQFLSQYLQDKQGTQQQAPVMMGGQPGGQAPSSPESRPRDIKSATKAFKQSLGLF